MEGADSKARSPANDDYAGDSFSRPAEIGDGSNGEEGVVEIGFRWFTDVAEQKSGARVASVCCISSVPYKSFPTDLWSTRPLCSLTERWLSMSGVATTPYS